MERWTVVGGRGWLGRHLAAALRERGGDVTTPRSAETPSGPAGHLVWASGVAYGADSSPSGARAAARGHVGDVERWLDAPGIRSFTYLSSTRVYEGSETTGEDDPLVMRGHRVYPTTKLAGESLVLAAAPNGRALRLANVFGPRVDVPLFLNDVLCGSVQGHVRLHSALASGKDYIGLADCVDLVIRIAREGEASIYNVAAGENTTNAQIVDALLAIVPGLEVTVEPNAPVLRTPVIDVSRIRNEFGFVAASLLAAIPDLYRATAEMLGRPAASRGPR